MQAELFGIKFDEQAQRKLEAALQRLPEEIVTKEARRALMSASKSVLERSKQLCPVESEVDKSLWTERETKAGASVSGLLRASLGKKSKVYQRTGVAVVVLGPRRGFKDPVTGRNPVHYAHLVHDGTKPHTIGKKHHPGSRAQPFLRTALFEKRLEVLARYRRQITRGVERQTRRCAR